MVFPFMRNLRERGWFLIVLLGFVALLTECGGGGKSEVSGNAPFFNSSPTSVTALTGQMVQFTASATGSPAPTYQWYRNGNGIPGATSTTLAYGPVITSDDQSKFFLRAQNSLGSSDSVVATLTVQSPIVITSQPADVYAQVNSSVTFKVSASGPGQIAYQWKVDGNPIPDATSAQFTTTFWPWLIGARFSVTVSNSSLSVDSRVAVLRLPEAPVITAQPTDLEVLAGQPATFSVQTDHTSDTLTYQWSRNGSPLQGQTGTSLTLASTTAGDDDSLFSVDVQGPRGTSSSRSARLRVDAQIQPPIFVDGPADVTVQEGADAIFQAFVAGTAPLQIVWQRDGVPVDGTWECIIPRVKATDDGAAIKVLATNQAGNPSRTVHLHVIPLSNIAPVADLIAPLSVSPNQQGVPVAAPSIPGLTCLWSVLPGTASATVSPQGSLATLSIGPTEGTFRLQVAVSNAVGSMAIASRTITVGGHGQWTRPYPELPSVANQGVAVQLASGFILMVGRAELGWPSFSQSSQIYDPVSGLWGPAAPTLAPRGGFSGATTRVPNVGFTATALLDGRALVVGGAVSPNTAEIYDPTSGTWAATASTGETTILRINHSAFRLEDGRVLIFGGIPPGGIYTNPLTQCLLFDPASGTWTPTGSMIRDMYGPATTRLPGGRLLVCGGEDIGMAPINICQIYDPGTGSWAATGSMVSPRSRHGLTVFPDGWALATGGATDWWNRSTKTSELWNPHTGQWQATGSLCWPVMDHSLMALGSGGALNAGGESGYYSDTELTDFTESFDPRTGQWTFDSFMAFPLRKPPLIPLSDGRVFQVGGIGNNFGPWDSNEKAWLNAQIYDPAVSVWTLKTPLLRSCTSSDAVLLNDGRFLVAGGCAFEGYELHRSGIVDPSTGTWSDTPPLKKSRYYHRMIRLQDSRVMVLGGTHYLPFIGWVAMDSVEIFDPQSGTWSEAASMKVPRSNHTCTLLADGRVLVSGGSRNSDAAEIFDPRTGIWTLTGPMVNGTHDRVATLLPDGRVLVVGGGDNYGISEAEIFNPVTNTWVATAPMAAYRSGHTATLVGNRVLVVGGPTGAEWFDPVAGSWSAGPTPATTRYSHTATLLPDGRLLITSGRETDGNNPIASCEILDPSKGTWTPAAPLPFARVAAQAVALPSGSVVLFADEDPMLQFQIYTP